MTNPIRMPDARSRASLRLRAPLVAAVLSVFAFAGEAGAAPASVQVCKQVLDNQDTNHAEGGAWDYTVANQAVTLGAPSVTRVESQSATPATCAPAIALPAGSSALSVIEAATTPANWLRTAPGYPRWTIEATGLAPTAGSGRTAALSGSAFANASGTARVTFIGASGRRLTSLCASMVDNATAPAGQGGGITIDIDGALTRTFPSVLEGAAASCDAAVALDLGVGQQSLTITEAFGFSGAMAANYPIATVIGSASGSASAPLPSPPQSGTIAIDGTAGDITLAISHRIDTQRQVTICSTIEDNADAINHSGPVQFATPVPNENSLLAPVEGGPEVCGNALPVPGSETTSVFRELSYGGAFEGMAFGYPKWTIVDAAAPATALVTGSGPVADITWSNPALAGRTRLKIRFVDKAGAFGNGVGAGTGAIVRLCTRLEDNGVAPSGESAAYTLYGTVLDGIGVTTQATTVSEGGLACPTSLALWAADQAFALGEIDRGGAASPGNPFGFPRLRIFNSAAPSATATPLQDLPMSYRTSPVDGFYTAAFTSDVKADRTAVVVNRIGTPAARRTLQVCLRVDSNGIAPANSGGVWEGLRFGSLTATEGSGRVCGPVQALPDTALDWTSPYQIVFDVPAGFPGFDVLQGGPQAATPYVAYTTTGGNSGTVPMLAQRSGDGSTAIYWRPDRSFFAATSGNMTAEIVIRPSGKLSLCSQVVANGDAINDSNTFTVTDLYTVGGTVLGDGVPLTAVEGQPPVCRTSIWLPTGYDERAARQALPATWNGANNTPGFPLWRVSSNGPTPTNVSGSGLETSPLVQAPAAAQGDVTVTFLNRQGAPRFLTLCEQLEDNNDGQANGGTFTIGVTTDDPAAPTVGPVSLPVTEGATRLCAAPIQLSGPTGNLQATETLPAGFVSANTYPKWTVANDADVVRASGTGLTTGLIALSTIDSPDLSVTFRNRAGADADLRVTKTGPATAQAGSSVTYTLTVANDGPLAAQAVSIADPTPTALVFTTASAPCATGFPCALGALAAGATRTVTVTYAIPAGYLSGGNPATITNRATVSATTPDPNAANNTAQAQTAVGQTSDVAIVKSNGVTRVVLGEIVRYELLVSNGGPSPVNGVRIVDVLPTTLVGGTWTCATVSGGATCGAASGSGNVDVLVNLPTGAVARVLVDARVSGTAGGFVDNIATATVPAVVVDPVSTNNTSRDNDVIANDGLFSDGFEDDNRVLNVDVPASLREYPADG